MIEKVNGNSASIEYDRTLNEEKVRKSIFLISLDLYCRASTLSVISILSNLGFLSYNLAMLFMIII